MNRKFDQGWRDQKEYSEASWFFGLAGMCCFVVGLLVFVYVGLVL